MKQIVAHYTIRYRRVDLRVFIDHAITDVDADHNRTLVEVPRSKTARFVVLAKLD